MIKNNYPTGKRLFNTVEFGTGDIGILGPSVTPENRVAIVLWQHEDKPETEWEEKIIEKSTDDLPDGSIVLSFNKLKSVDQLIKALQEARIKLADFTPLAQGWRHA